MQFHYFLSPATELPAYMVKPGSMKEVSTEERVTELPRLKCRQSDEHVWPASFIYCFILQPVDEKNVSSDEEEDIIGPAPPAEAVRTL